MERMVSTRPKKAAKKVQRSRKKVEPTADASTETFAPAVTFAPEEPVIDPIPIKPVASAPTVKKVDYKALLAEAPDVPYLTKMEDAVKFVDEYARWKRKVQAAT